MTTVVGLDLSLVRAGIAAIDTRRHGHDSIAWPWYLRSCGRDGHKGEDWRKRSRRVRKQTADVLALLEPIGRPDLVVLEGPIYAGTIKPSYFDRAALFHGVLGRLDARDIPFAVVSPTTGHLFTTGKGSLPNDPDRLKVLILESVQAMVPDVHIANHDIADALGLAFMGGMSLGLQMPFRPHRWQYEAVYTPAWPHGAPIQRPVHRA